jgi:pilus assembly protein CpaD
MSWSERMNRAPAPIAALVLAASLVGCTSVTRATGGPVGPEPITPTERYAIEVTRQPDEVALAVHPQGLSPAQRSALADLAGRWREADGGPVIVRAPGSGPDARRTAEHAAAYLNALGIPRELIRLTSYEAAGPVAPVVASFEAYQAHGPECAHTWDNLASTGTNQASRHFGCTVTANFAAQIANPKDLISPAQMTAADNTRRSVVLGKYRKGEVSSAAKDAQATGAISAAVSK